MKKKISVLLVAITAMLSLTACGKFTCDMCGQEKVGKNHKIEILGEEIIICDDCKSAMEDVGNALDFLN